MGYGERGRVGGWVKKREGKGERRERREGEERGRKGEGGREK